MTPQIIRPLTELRSKVRIETAGESVAVVPTMGALHQGHLEPCSGGERGCDRVIVTIFIKPQAIQNPQTTRNYPPHRRQRTRAS